MKDLWAAIGACCIDGELRNQVQKELDDVWKKLPGDGRVRLSNLESFQRLMRDRCGVDLSRWELMEMVRICDPRHDAPTGTTEADRHYDPFEVMKNIGHFFGKAVFPDDLEFCAVVGLACIDETYRRELYWGCSNTDHHFARLVKILQEKKSLPNFRNLRAQDFVRVNRLMKKDKEVSPRTPRDERQEEKRVWWWMRQIQENSWESPDQGNGLSGSRARLSEDDPDEDPTIFRACATGYSIDEREYWHVSQPRLGEVMDDRAVMVQVGDRDPQPLPEYLREKKVVMGG